MTKEQIERLDTLYAKATSGEWMVYDSNSFRRIGLKGPYKEILWADTYSRTDRHPDFSGINRDADLACLMAIHNAWPALRDFARTLERENAALRAQLAAAIDEARKAGT